MPKQEGIAEEEHGRQAHETVARGVAVFVLLASLSIVEACGSDTTAKNDESPGKMATGARSAASTAAAGEGGSRMIPQPPVPADIPVAPESKRVDLSMPNLLGPDQGHQPAVPCIQARLGADGRPC